MKRLERFRDSLSPPPATRQNGEEESAATSTTSGERVPGVAAQSLVPSPVRRDGGPGRGRMLRVLHGVGHAGHERRR